MLTQINKHHKFYMFITFNKRKEKSNKKHFYNYSQDSKIIFNISISVRINSFIAFITFIIKSLIYFIAGQSIIDSWMCRVFKKRFREALRSLSHLGCIWRQSTGARAQSPSLILVRNPKTTFKMMVWKG